MARQEVVRAETAAAELDAARREKVLESEVRKPADAEAYRQVTLADAARQTEILHAQAEAEQTTLRGEAEAKATEVNGRALAMSIEARGRAEAVGIEAEQRPWHRTPTPSSPSRSPRTTRPSSRLVLVRWATSTISSSSTVPRAWRIYWARR